MQPHSKWSELDFILFEAYEMMRSETSTQTGLPIYLTRAGDPRVSFRVDTLIDEADEALEKHKAEQAEKKDKAYGLVAYVVPDGQGSPVPEGGLERERLLEQVQKRVIDGPGGPMPGSTLPEGLIDRKRPAKGYDLSEYG